MAPAWKTAYTKGCGGSRETACGSQCPPGVLACTRKADSGVGVRRVTADRLDVRGQAKPGAKDAPRSGRPGGPQEEGGLAGRLQEQQVLMFCFLSRTMGWESTLPLQESAV